MTQAVSEGPRFAASVDFFGESQQLVQPMQQPLSGEALSGLRGWAVDLEIGVDIVGFWCGRRRVGRRGQLRWCLWDFWGDSRSR